MKTATQLCLALLFITGVAAGQSASALTLEQLIQIGMDNNSDIRIAERTLAAARVGRLGSYSGLIPSMRVSMARDLKTASYTDPFTGSPVERNKEYGSQLSMSQTIFKGGAGWYDARLGALSVKSSQAAFNMTRIQVVLGIKESYYNLLSRLELLEVAEETLELSRRQLELVEERFRLQAVKETDLLKARVSVGQRESDRYRARQGVAIAATSLNLAIGQDPSASLNVARDSVALEPVPDREVAFRLLKTTNPALELQAFSVEQAWLNAKKQRGNLMPSVSMGYSVSASDTLLPGAYDYDFENRGVASVSLSFPFFTGLRNTSQYVRSRYLALAEEEGMDALERDLKRQLENTLSSLESLQNIFPIDQEVLASAEADVRLADEQYKLGTISILGLLDAQWSLIQARSTLVRTTYEIKIAEAQLEALMGTIE